MLQNYIFIAVANRYYGLEFLSKLNVIFILVAFTETLYYYGVILANIKLRNDVFMSKACSALNWFLMPVWTVYLVFQLNDNIYTSGVLALFGYSFSSVLLFRRALIISGEKRGLVFIGLNAVLIFRILAMILEFSLETVFLTFGILSLVFVYSTMSIRRINFSNWSLKDFVNLKSYSIGSLNFVSSKGQMIATALAFTPEQSGLFFLLKSSTNLFNVTLEYVNLIIAPYVKKFGRPSMSHAKNVKVLSGVLFVISCIVWLPLYEEKIFPPLGLVLDLNIRSLLFILLLSVIASLLRVYSELELLAELKSKIVTIIWRESVIFFSFLLVLSMYEQSLLLLAAAQLIHSAYFVLRKRLYGNNM